jgi:hypothetical protein
MDFVTPFYRSDLAKSLSNIGTMATISYFLDPNIIWPDALVRAAAQRPASSITPTTITPTNIPDDEKGRAAAEQEQLQEALRWEITVPLFRLQ